MSSYRKKVFVGLSGGVDSAVSAALLQQQGYDVRGVFIRIVVPGYPCTAGADKIDAMRVAAHLKIPFTEIDLSKEYSEEVFKTSIAEFAKGKTPNPDVLCNREIKFGLFYEYAIKQGADMVATGHYAQMLDGKLYAGKDTNKDQSYFLWAVPTEVLQHTLFPVGHLEKSEVRRLAHKFGLPNSERPDSQGLCFLGPISIEDMLMQELKPTRGNVLDEEGTTVGKHQGAALYTLGQRHGFTLAAQTPNTAAHFVIAKNIEANTITVSTNKFPRHATKTELTLSNVNWIGGIPEGKVQARYRYRQKLIPAHMSDTSVVLDEPHFAPEGQSLVLYKGEECLGGGIIQKTDIY
jgi:tRNA-specific 2-thiouridylase